MKQFLRFQISGTTFLLWLIVFYYGQDAKNLDQLFQCISPQLETLKIIGVAVVALPFGAIIHQFSVTIKNCIVGKIVNEFSDFPDKDITSKCDTECVKYCMKRISNLNTYYYVRVDNALLSPCLAFLIIAPMDGSIDFIWICFALIIGIITLVYLYRIYLEIKKYKQIIDEHLTNHST